MKIVVIDSTAVVATGPGSPAYFSRFVIKRLREAGHEVSILPGFDEQQCRDADLVWTEWVNEEAFETARAGVCKRLAVRMRGFDAHGPLDQLEWSNVGLLVYESAFIRDLVERRFPGLRGFRTDVIPSGIDVASIQYNRREPASPVLALVARTTADKGYQLAFEYARQRPEIALHVTTALSEASPRLMAYLEHTKPANVTIRGTVDTPSWLNAIGATHLLSCSIWETLGYTIAEGMAVGCKPLIHDAPGTSTNWPKEYLWRGFSDLDKLIAAPFDSRDYRTYVEQHLNEHLLSQKFIDTVLALPAQTPVAPAGGVANLGVAAGQAIVTGDLVRAEDLVTRLRSHTRKWDGLEDIRAGLAFNLSGAYYDRGELDRAQVWAARSLLDIMRPEPLCVIGEVAAANEDIEMAVQWYRAACAVEDVPSRFSAPGISGSRHERLAELKTQLRPALAAQPLPMRYLIVVATRNSEKWIRRCLESIKTQSRPFLCVVMDDVSTDGTWREIEKATLDDYRFITKLNTFRLWSLRNISTAVDMFGEPGDVVVIVDGDDWLAGPQVLEHFDVAYASGAWVTHGNFTVLSSGKKSWMPPYPQYVIREHKFRSYPWSVSHPKTFKRELFDKIAKSDFKHDGEWLKVAGDVALMMPLLEMSSERTVYIDEPVYVYNDTNAESDHRLVPHGQVQVRDIILDKVPYTRLEKL